MHSKQVAMCSISEFDANAKTEYGERVHHNAIVIIIDAPFKHV